MIERYLKSAGKLPGHRGQLSASLMTLNGYATNNGKISRVVTLTYPEDKPMTPYTFDDRNIHWHKLGYFEHIVYSILDIDINNKIVDVLFKLEPHKQIVLHRHKALNKTLVIQGEHHLYKANGDIKEVRAVGSYTSSPASEEPHRECGGDQGAGGFFSIRGGEGILYEILDDQESIIGTLSFQDFSDLFAAHKNY